MTRPEQHFRSSPACSVRPGAWCTLAQSFGSARSKGQIERMWVGGASEGGEDLVTGRFGGNIKKRS